MRIALSQKICVFMGTPNCVVSGDFYFLANTILLTCTILLTEYNTSDISFQAKIIQYCLSWKSFHANVIPPSQVTFLNKRISCANRSNPTALTRPDLTPSLIRHRFFVVYSPEFFWTDLTREPSGPNRPDTPPELTRPDQPIIPTKANRPVGRVGVSGRVDPPAFRLSGGGGGRSHYDALIAPPIQKNTS